MTISDEIKREIIESVEELKSLNRPIWGEICRQFEQKYHFGMSKEAYRHIYRRREKEDEGFDKHINQVARNLLQVKEQRKILVKQRAMVDYVVKEYSEKSIVSDTIMAVWGKEQFHQRDVQVIKVGKCDEKIIYAYSDVHYDYTINEKGMIYNKAIAEKRIWEIFTRIVNDVKMNGYKEIYISDGADMIEGAGLRISQLLRITEVMTQQAKEYSDIIIACVKWISKQLPDVKITYLMVSEDNHAQLRLYNTKRNEMDENLCILITNAVKNVIETAHEYGGMENIEFITADEILLTFDGDKPFNTVIAHGSQYSKGDDILEQTEKRHKCPTHLYIGAHWHRFSVKSKDVKDDTLQSIIHLPAVCGDTDFSDKMYVSGLPGFAKIIVDLKSRISNGLMIGLEN